MHTYIDGSQRNGTGRSYFGSESLTPAQKRAILSLPEDGGYGTLLDGGSIRSSLVLMGFIAGGCSARWGMGRSRLTTRGRELRHKLEGRGS